MRHIAPMLLALALLAGCGDPIQQYRPPLDRIFFPTGLTVAPRPGGGDLLYVVNSNFDLEYAADEGGSVLAIDPEASVPAAPGGLAPPAIVGALRIPSYGGEVRVAHPGLPGCEGLGRTTAIVPVRYTNEVYAIDVGADGTLSCGDDCRLPVTGDARDPFGVTIACRATGSGTRHSAFVAHLSGRPVEGAPAGEGFVTEIDLATRAAGATVNLGSAPAAQLAFDPGRGLLFASPAMGALGYAPIRWWRPVAADSSQFEYSVSDVNAFLPSSIVRGMALSSDRQRLYVSADLYDPILAATAGSIRITGAVVVVLEITVGTYGETALRLSRVTPTGVGAGPLALVPRPGMRDLLVLTDTAGNEVHLYDDEVGALVGSLGRDAATGRPHIREPFALAPQALPGGAWRVWVASFRDGTITAIELDDPAVPGTARVGKRIGNLE